MSTAHRTLAAPALLVFLIVSGAGPLLAESNSTYSFLRADLPARPAALAGSFVSVSGDPSAILYNPAGAATISVPAGAIGFTKHLMDINAGMIVYTHPLEGAGNLSAGLVYFDYGSFDETDELGNVLGTFGARDLAFSAGYSGASEAFSYGGAVKFIASQIAGFSSTALALDAGVQYAVPETRLTLGAAVRNLGTQLGSFSATRENLPLDLVVGASVVPRGIPLLLNVNFHRLTDDVPSVGDRFKAFTVGGEFTLSQVLKLRFGFNNEQRSELKVGSTSGLAGFSGGLGVQVEGYLLDYSLNSLGSIGALHRVTLGTTF